MVVPCVAQLSDPNDEAMAPRRCSARIKNLKSEQEAQRERQRPSIDNPAIEKKTKVYKKRKVDTPSKPDVTVTPVEDNNVADCTDHPLAESPHLSGNVNEKSAHVRVTETIRRFNKHYLHFVQEEEIRCGRVQADQKTKKNSKSKETEDDGKRSSKRPDLKAISKMISAKEVLNLERIGSIPGIDVGHQFFSRAEMVVVGFHNHWLNGIDCVGQSAGKKAEYKGYSLPLAVSIVVSGQYEDDQDNYEEIVYTGQGGNDLLGNKRQIKDQIMERGNLGLKNCMEHSVPVRVTRGHRCVNSYVGRVYTYDGLYKVVNYWAEKGISGFTVYKFRLKRIEGQPVLTTNQVHFTRGCVPNSISEIRGLVCEDISGGLENIPIPATNLVDDPPVAPTGLTYKTNIIFAKGIKLPSAPTGCNCRGSCLDPRVCSCAKLNGSDFPYVHKDGGRLIEPKAVVFECGPNCGCGPACVNRTSQKGLRYRLEVFRTPNKGWGVRSWDYIPSGATICEYIGLLKKTDQIDPAADNNYVFDIDCLQTMKGLDGRERRLGEVSLPGGWQKDVEKTSDGGPEYCIDAVSVGNVARFINHSCQPNLFVQCVLSTHHDLGLARVVLMAADNIPPLQAVDGQHLILHPLNMKCLLHYYGGYDSLPNRISGKIVQMETVTQSEAMRRRYRFLSHFSLTTTFQLCEIDLSKMLPMDALSPFMEEIKSREKQRKWLARKEWREQVKAEAIGMHIEPLPFSFSEPSFTEQPTFTSDDFEALGSTSATVTSSPPVPGGRQLFSNVARLGFAAGCDPPAVKMDESARDSSVAAGTRSSGIPSFANVTSKAKVVEGPNASKSNDAGKRGKKPNRVLMSTSGGRRY